MTDNRVANILVVVDDPPVVTAIRVALENMGEYNVSVVRSGSECLRRLENERPDLILLDTETVGTHGAEVIRRLRSRPGSSEIPVLMVSADAQIERMAAYYEAGANGFLIKPFDAGSFYRQVRSAIAQSKVNVLQNDASR